jgi:hypothetical protein
VELVDTRDLKSLARMGMRVRSPPVLPSKTEKYPIDYCSEVDNEEIFVYNRRGKLVNIRNLWRSDV